MERDAVTGDLGEREWKERQWRQKALPSFNSMAIESRIGWLPGLVSQRRASGVCSMIQSDVTLALNDDFFLLRPHAVGLQVGAGLLTAGVGFSLPSLRLSDTV